MHSFVLSLFGDVFVENEVESRKAEMRRLDRSPSWQLAKHVMQGYNYSYPRLKKRESMIALGSH